MSAAAVASQNPPPLCKAPLCPHAHRHCAQEWSGRTQEYTPGRTLGGSDGSDPELTQPASASPAEARRHSDGLGPFGPASARSQFVHSRACRVQTSPSPVRRSISNMTFAHADDAHSPAGSCRTSTSREEAIDKLKQMLHKMEEWEAKRDSARPVNGGDNERKLQARMEVPMSA